MLRVDTVKLAFLLLLVGIIVSDAIPLSNTELKANKNSCKAAGWNVSHEDCANMPFWDTSMVTDMRGLFAFDRKFNIDISQWDTSRVENMMDMFNAAESFNADISRWNTSSVTTMDGMFQDAFAFNADLSSWDTGEVVNMREVFRKALVFNGDLSKWNTGKVDDMYRMFYLASSFNSDISQWNTTGVLDMDQMFRKASSFNGNLTAWDMSNVDRVRSMFEDAISFNGDVSKWNTSSFESVSGIFRRATSFNGDLSRWEMSSVRYMTGVFEGASSFNGDISHWNTSSVIAFDGMFEEASSFNGDISNWDTSNADSMAEMFDGASSFNGDISRWDTGRVQEMYWMFARALSFNADISAWDLSAATEISHMFEGASSFNIDISHWDVSAVTDTSFMFRNASSFNVDLCPWGLSEAQAESLFDGTPKLSLCDVDECRIDGACPDETVCSNNDGSFTCSAPDSTPIAECGAILQSAHGCTFWARNDVVIGTGSLEGKLCVGGSFTSGQGFSIQQRSAAHCEDGDFSLVVGGNVTVEAMNILAATPHSFPYCVGGEVAERAGSHMLESRCPQDSMEDSNHCREVIDFEAEHARLVALSEILHQIPTGFRHSTAVLREGVILISVDSSSPLHVVSLQASLFDGWAAWGLRIEVIGSMDEVELVVVDLEGVGEEGLIISKWFDYPLEWASKILFNHAGTQPFGVGGGTAVFGSLLAPRAALFGTSAGAIHGQIIVDSYLTTSSASMGMVSLPLRHIEVCLEPHTGQELSRSSSKEAIEQSAPSIESPASQFSSKAAALTGVAILLGAVVLVLAASFVVLRWWPNATRTPHSSSTQSSLFLGTHRKCQLPVKQSQIDHVEDPAVDATVVFEPRTALHSLT